MNNINKQIQDDIKSGRFKEITELSSDVKITYSSIDEIG